MNRPVHSMSKTRPRCSTRSGASVSSIEPRSRGCSVRRPAARRISTRGGRRRRKRSTTFAKSHRVREAAEQHVNPLTASQPVRGVLTASLSLSATTDSVVRPHLPTNAAARRLAELVAQSGTVRRKHRAAVRPGHGCTERGCAGISGLNEKAERAIGAKRNALHPHPAAAAQAVDVRVLT
jgi:N-acetylmuramoyl-L-alanine amidase